jgi:hypothetical protein
MWQFEMHEKPHQFIWVQQELSIKGFIAKGLLNDYGG